MIPSKRNRAVNGKPVALVTGGGKGIGAAVCRCLADRGFRVGIHYRSSSEAAAALQQRVADSFVLQADLAATDQIDRLISSLKTFAGRVDVLVNNAGASVNALTMAMKIDDFDRQRELLRGTWYLTKSIVRRFMLRAGHGRIINISSVVGHTGNAGQVAYTMEKAATDAMSKSLSKELAGSGILVNSVAPGFIATEMTASLPGSVREAIMNQIPLGRMGAPEEVAEVVAFLATGGGYINGSVIHVNGGLYGG